MKKSLKSILLLLLIACPLTKFLAQTPCSGLPGSNTVIPLTQTICAGTPVSMVLANGYTASGITYQWQSSTVSAVGPFTSIPGATLHAYSGSTGSNPTSTNPVFFNVIITCTNSGLSISVPYSVTVVPCNTPCTGTPAPSSVLPANPTVCIGSSAALNLSTTYTGTGISYQWSAGSSGSGPFTALPNATLGTYVTPTLSANGYYQVVITCTNSGASYTATQMVSALSCTYCSGPPPSNTIIPGNPTVCAGGSTSLGLATSYSTTGFNFQWQQSTTSAAGPFAPIAGATGSTYNTPALNTTTYFNVVITCTNGGQSLSLTQSVTVLSCTAPCTGIPQQTGIVPANATVCAGSSVSLALTAAYPQSGISFQWGNAAAAAGPYTAVPGATANTYVTPSLSTNAYYNVVITCSNSGQNTSASTSLAVISCTGCTGTPGSNTIIPVNSTVCASTPFTLGLAAPYSATGYTYQWKSSTISQVGPFSPVTGGTAAVLSSTGITQTTYYNLVITCTVSGQSINLYQVVSVMPCAPPCQGAPPANTIVPVGSTVCAGSALALSLANSFTASGYSYQWYSSTVAAGPFSPISGASGTVYSHPGSNVTTYYWLVVNCTNLSASSTYSQVVTVTPCITPCQGPPASNTILPVNSTLCIGSPITLSLASTYSNSGLTFQWSSAPAASGPFTNIAGANGTVYTVPALQNSTYFRLIVTCPQSGFSNTVTQLVTAVPCYTPCQGPPASNTILPVNHSVCVGTAASMSLAYTYTDTGIAYQWEGSSAAAGPFSLIPGATAASYNSPVLNATTYYNAVITCTNGNQATRVSHTVTVNQCGVGFEEYRQSLQDITLYPNPNDGKCTIACKLTGHKQITVSDLTGRILYSKESTEFLVSLDLSLLKPGLYLVEVKTILGSRDLRMMVE